MINRAALGRLSLNQRTTASWSPEAIKGSVDAGLGAIGIWREQLAEIGLDEACRLVAESRLRVSSLCRGGFLQPPIPTRRRQLRRATGGDRGGGRAECGDAGTRARWTTAWRSGSARRPGPCRPSHRTTCPVRP